MPAPAKAPEGTIIQSSQTGERRVLRNGNWVRMDEPQYMREKLTTEDADELKKLREAATSARRLKGGLAAFSEANSGGADRFGGATGPLNAPNWELPFGLGRPFASLGSNELEVMRSLQSEMTPYMHMTGGPMTDADARTYRQALPGPDRLGTQNAEIIAGLNKRAQQVIARQQAADRWVSEYGTLRGFAEAFDRQQAAAPNGQGAPRAPESKPRRLY